jgi:hypothetical protein
LAVAALAAFPLPVAAQPDEPAAGGQAPEEPEPEPPAPEAEPRAEPVPKVPARAPRERQKPAGAKDDKRVAGDVAEPEGSWRERLRLDVGPVYLAPIVLVAVQLTPYVGDEAFFQAGDIAERPGFRLRHARLGIEAGYTDQARLRVSGELGSDEGNVRIHDAWAAYTPFSYLEIAGGALKVPFSRNELLSTGRGALIERPLLVRATAPGNQVGGVISGEVADAAFGYAIGVSNGLQRAGQFYQGYEENYAIAGNRFDGLLFAARLTTEPLGALPITAADEEQGPARFGLGANYLVTDGGVRDVHQVGGDGHLMVRGFHLILEGLWLRTLPETEPTQPTDLVAEQSSWGLSAEAGYMILPRMLGLAARFEWIDPDVDSDDESDNWLITGGAHFQFIDQLLKLQADYTHREERYGLSLANDSVTLQLQGQLDMAARRRGGAGAP